MKEILYKDGFGINELVEIADGKVSFYGFSAENHIIARANVLTDEICFLVDGEVILDEDFLIELPCKDKEDAVLINFLKSKGCGSLTRFQYVSITNTYTLCEVIEK